MINQLKNNDLCPICEIGRLKEQVKDDVVNICGKMIKVKDMKSFTCNVCNDGFLMTKQLIDWMNLLYYIGINNVKQR